MAEVMGERDCLWSSRARLDDLLRRVTVCLQGAPGFETLSVFGSLAEGRADGYSDLDLIVTTDDLAAARETVPGMLEAVGAVESCWTVRLRDEEWNSTVIFAGEGYYHKLDLCLASAGATNRTIPAEQATLLVTRVGEAPAVSARQSAAYAPGYGSVGHFLLGQFIGGVRYVKARKRGQALSCYRFVSAAADWLMRALYAWLTGDGALNAKLSTGEYTALDRLDVEGYGRAMLAGLDYSTPEKMDQSLCHVFWQLYGLCQKIAAASNEHLDDGVFERMLAFIGEELGLNLCLSG